MGSPRGRRLPRRSAPCLSAPSRERSWPAPLGPGGTLNPPVTPSARHLSPRDRRLHLPPPVPAPPAPPPPPPPPAAGRRYLGPAPSRAGAAPAPTVVPPAK